MAKDCISCRNVRQFVSNENLKEQLTSGLRRDQALEDDCKNLFLAGYLAIYKVDQDNAKSTVAQDAYKIDTIQNEISFLIVFLFEKKYSFFHKTYLK